MYYIFNSNVNVWDCVKDLSSMDDYTALQSFAKEIWFARDKKNLELWNDEILLARVGEVKGTIPKLVICLNSCSIETFCKLKSRGLSFARFAIS